MRNFTVIKRVTHIMVKTYGCKKVVHAILTAFK